MGRTRIDVEDIVGTDNGKVEILKYVGKIKDKHHYNVKCNFCDKIWRMERKSVIKGNGCASCSSLNRPSRKLSLKEVESFVGFESDKVKVIGYVGIIKGFYYYEVECLSCEKVWKMEKNNIKIGNGCQSCSNKSQVYINLKEKYDLTDKDIQSLNKRYSSMMGRCYDISSSSYHNYGGRGIKVCSEWIKSKLSYMEHLCSIGFNIDLEIDRINNDGNYCPENVRCVSRTVNCLNRRTNNKHPLIYKHNDGKNSFCLHIIKIDYSKCFETLSDAIKTRDKLIVKHKLVDYYELLNK